MKVLIVLIAAAALAAILYLAGRSPRRAKLSSFVGNPMNDKQIVVQGWTDAELRRILADFEKMYDGRLGSAYSAVLQNKGSSIRLSFPNDLPADEFCFLVNYINYPEGFDLKNRSATVSGHCTLSDASGIPDKTLIGQSALFYVPSNDQEYDLVYVRVGNRTFENSFASTHWKPVDDPRLPPGVAPLR